MPLSIGRRDCGVPASEIAHYSPPDWTSAQGKSAGQGHAAPRQAFPNFGISDRETQEASLNGACRELSPAMTVAMTIPLFAALISANKTRITLAVHLLQANDFGRFRDYDESMSEIFPICIVGGFPVAADDLLSAAGTAAPYGFARRRPLLRR